MEVKIKCKGAAEANLSELIPFQGDLKTLTEENYKKFRKEILELGFSEPISIWEKDGKKYILNGHQRLRTLTQMKSEGVYVPNTIPVNIVEADNEKQAKKKVLALTSQFGEIENQGLYEFMHNSELTFEEVKESMRFPEIDFDKFEAEFFEEPKEEHTDPDDVPTNVEPRVKTGELWQLGDHRLLCGDATKTEDVERLMGGEKADMVFTDPPYGVNIVGGGKPFGKVGGGKPFGKVGGGNMVPSKTYKVIEGDNSTETAKKALAIMGKDMPKIIWGGNYFSHSLDETSGWLVWNKEMTGNFGDGELAWTNSEKPLKIFKHTWNGLIKESERREKRIHPTQKPIALAEWCFENYGDPKSVLDVFGGSGSTLIACEKTNRKCFMMEIDPHYCDVIIKRYEDYTNKKATLLNGNP